MNGVQSHQQQHKRPRRIPPERRAIQLHALAGHHLAGQKRRPQQPRRRRPQPRQTPLGLHAGNRTHWLQDGLHAGCPARQLHQQAAQPQHTCVQQQQPVRQLDAHPVRAENSGACVVEAGEAQPRIHHGQPHQKHGNGPGRKHQPQSVALQKLMLAAQSIAFAASTIAAAFGQPRTVGWQLASSGQNSRAPPGAIPAYTSHTRQPSA